MTRSIVPLARPSRVSLDSLSDWKRDSGRIVTGNWPKRSANVA